MNSAIVEALAPDSETFALFTLLRIRSVLLVWIDAVSAESGLDSALFALLTSLNQKYFIWYEKLINNLTNSFCAFVLANL